MKPTSSKSEIVPPKKASATRRHSVAKQAAPRWKIGGGMVCFQTGTNTLFDIKVALKALEDAE